MAPSAWKKAGGEHDGRLGGRLAFVAGDQGRQRDRGQARGRRAKADHEYERLHEVRQAEQQATPACAAHAGGVKGGGRERGARTGPAGQGQPKKKGGGKKPESPSRGPRGPGAERVPATT